MKTSLNNTVSNNSQPVVNSTEPTSGYQAEPTVQQPVEEKVDDFGYEKDITPEPPKPSEVITNEPQEEEKEPEITNPSTGYGDDPKPEDKKPDEKKPDETPTQEDTEKKLKEEIDQVISSLDDNFDKEIIAKFANEQKLNKDQLSGYIELLKSERERSIKENQEFIANQRKEWLNELKGDPDFGGEHFAKNVDRVEKVLDKFLPNVKKALTERKSMLPPYIMRDLLSLSKVLNPTTKLVGGEPRIVENKNANFLDEMYQ